MKRIEPMFHSALRNYTLNVSSQPPIRALWAAMECGYLDPSANATPFQERCAVFCAAMAAYQGGYANPENSILFENAIAQYSSEHSIWCIAQNMNMGNVCFVQELAKAFRVINRNGECPPINVEQAHHDLMNWHNDDVRYKWIQALADPVIAISDKKRGIETATVESDE